MKRFVCVSVDTVVCGARSPWEIPKRSLLGNWATWDLGEGGVELCGLLAGVGF